MGGKGRRGRKRLLFSSFCWIRGCKGAGTSTPTIVILWKGAKREGKKIDGWLEKRRAGSLFSLFLTKSVLPSEKRDGKKSTLFKSSYFVLKWCGWLYMFCVAFFVLSRNKNSGTRTSCQRRKWKEMRQPGKVQREGRDNNHFLSFIIDTTRPLCADRL